MDHQTTQSQSIIAKPASLKRKMTDRLPEDSSEERDNVCIALVLYEQWKLNPQDSQG